MSPTLTKKPVVLIVEDEPDVRNTLAVWIELEYRKRFGVSLTIHKAESFDEASAFIDTTPIDVIVTDIDMPGRNGLDLAQFNAGRIPLLCISARDPKLFATQALEVAPHPMFLPKPTMPDECEELVTAIFDWVHAKMLWGDKPFVPWKAPKAEDAPLVVPAEGPPTDESPASPRRTGRNHLPSHYAGTVLVVRMEYGPSHYPPNENEGMTEFTYTQRACTAFETAVDAHGGDFVIVFGQLLGAVFAEQESNPATLSEADAMSAARDFRALMKKAVPTIADQPLFAAGVATGPFQIGLFGEGAMRMQSVVGRVVHRACFLATVAKLGSARIALGPDESTEVILG